MDSAMPVDMPNANFSLDGKTIAVTGGRGTGRIIALACANAGADIVVSSRKLRQLLFSSTMPDRFW